MKTPHIPAVILVVLLAGSCQKDLPVADFTNSTPVYQGVAVSFVNLSQNATDYTWDFGDGATSTEANPTHTYSQKGTYEVRLTAHNDDGSASVVKTLQLKSYVESLAGDYAVTGVKTDWGGWASSEYYPVGTFTFNVAFVNDTTLKVLGWEVLKRPGTSPDYCAFADKLNYIHMGSHTGAYFTYYTATDSIYCLIKHESLGGGTRWTYRGKKL